MPLIMIYIIQNAEMNRKANVFFLPNYFASGAPNMGGFNIEWLKLIVKE